MKKAKSSTMERHTPPWAIKEEREGEAENPGPGDDAGDEVENLRIESVNASSAHANKLAIFKCKAHLQFVQESCLTKGLLATFEKEAKEVGKSVIGSPLDPEHSKAAAGVAAVAVVGLAPYPVPEPTDDYLDAEATGRCKIVCTDIGGCTLAVAHIMDGLEGLKAPRKLHGPTTS